MSQVSAWCFTLNNPSEDGPTLLSRLEANPQLRFVVFQLEKAASGTLHFQGYLEFRRSVRLSTLRALLPGAHAEVRRGTAAEATAYCTKEDTREDGPWTFGEPSAGQGTRSDIERACALVREGGLALLREKDPASYVRYSRGFEALDRAMPVPRRGSPPEVILLYGPTGCGKTRFFYDNTEEATSYATPITSGVWFDGYMGQPDVLIDDFDGAIQLRHALRLFDRYSLSVPIKGGFVIWSPQRIFVTTNLHPRQWYDYDKREEQFFAIVRRFTRFVLFRRDGSSLDTDLAGAVGWRDGFVTPRDGGHEYDGIGGYVVREPFDQYTYY